VSATAERSGLTVNGVPYEVVMGIECHVELKTQSKMFCGCRNLFGAEPNTNVCPVCLGLPGALPVPNRRAIELVVKAGLAFGAEIPAFSKFDRKNYFYPDMPKDYQISQYDMPLTMGGVVRFWRADGTQGSCRLTRIHLEEDTGKSSHAGSRDGRIAGSTYSLVDFNRAGVPLMECVSEPDIRNAPDAVAYLEMLKRTFVALGVSDVKMEEGSLRCDVNLSLRPVGQIEYGTKTEIKNMNSFNSVGRAIEFGGADLERLLDELDGLPYASLERLIEVDKLRVEQAHQIVDTPGLFAYYTSAAGISGRPQAVVNFLLGDLSRLANETGTPVGASGVTPQALGELVSLSEAGTINSKTAKELLSRMWVQGGSPQAIVAAEGLGQVSDASAVDAIVAEVLAANQATVAEYRAGKTKVLGFLVGQVMKASRGKANPTLAEERLRARLDASS